jgi:hypothetical protein
MAIIYSYTQETNPQATDLLFGTDVSAPDKATKSFTIGSIVELVETLVPGGGTVTSVGANDSLYITMSGGPITTSGTLTASLSASGTPSATTFLRGDNVWATPSAGENTTYELNSVQNGSSANIRLTGNDSTQTLVTLTPGANVTLTDNGSNRITIGLTGLKNGTVTSVVADGGLYIVSGDPTVNPTIGVDYTGLNNYIKYGEAQTTPVAADAIPFNQNSSTNVKTTRLGEIPVSALTLVKDYIDAGDVGDIRNDTDTFTDVANVNHVVSLSDTEYAGLASKDANTLYIVTTPAVEYTTTLAFTNNISGTEYTITGDQAGTTKTGASGASYAYNSNVVPNEGYYFSSGPSITNASGIFTANETVYTILSGTVSQIVVPGVTATLVVDTSGVIGSNFTLSGDLSGATQTGAAPLSYSFNTNIVANPGYDWVSGPTVSNASGTISANQTVVTTITGELQAVAPPAVTVTAVPVNNFTGSSNQVSFGVSPGSLGGDAPFTYDFTPYTFASANAGYEIVGLSITGDLSGTTSTSKNAVINFSGDVIAVENNAVVNLTVNNSISGPTAGYTINGDNTGAQQSGTVPLTYAFNTTVSLNEGYEWVSGQAPTISNAAGTITSSGVYDVFTTISGAQVVESTQTVNATLDITYNITDPYNVWSPTGYLDGATKTGLPGASYSFADDTPSITVPSGYGYSVPPSTVGDLTGTFDSVDKIIPVTVTATVIEVQQTGTVNLAFDNNIQFNGGADGSGVPYVTTTLNPPVASISGNVGDPYSWTHSVTANEGFEIETETWIPNATISGTIQAGSITVTQELRGNVISALGQFLGSTLAGDPSGACSLFVNQNYYHTGTGELPVQFDKVYSDGAATQPLPAGYYGMANNSGSFYGWFRIVGTNGDVDSTGGC